MTIMFLPTRNLRKKLLQQITIWKIRIDYRLFLWNWGCWMKHLYQIDTASALKEITAMRWQIRNYPDTAILEALHQALKITETTLKELEQSRQQP